MSSEIQRKKTAWPVLHSSSIHYRCILICRSKYKNIDKNTFKRKSDDPTSILWQSGCCDIPNKCISIKCIWVHFVYMYNLNVKVEEWSSVRYKSIEFFIMLNLCNSKVINIRGHNAEITIKLFGQPFNFTYRLHKYNLYPFIANNIPLYQLMHI